MKRDYLKYFTALLLFGSNGVIASFLTLSSYEIVLLRSILGSILLIAVFFYTSNKLILMKHRKDLIFIGLSGIAMAADWLFLFEAYAQIGVSLGMIINYCGPVIVIALSPVIFHERITSQKMIALTLAVLGAFFISGNAVFSGMSMWGLTCAILSAISYSVMVICNKKSKFIVGIENATLQLLFACITVVIFVGCKQGLLIRLTMRDYLPIIWLGFVNTGVSCYFYFSSIGKLPVQTVAICGYLEPVSAVILSYLFLHERMGVLQIIGALFIIVGSIYGEINQSFRYICHMGK